MWASAYIKLTCLIIRETAHIRRLARKVIDQRTEVEQFFIDALGYVKREIVANRLACMYVYVVQAVIVIKNFLYQGPWAPV